MSQQQENKNQDQDLLDDFQGEEGDCFGEEEGENEEGPEKNQGQLKKINKQNEEDKRSIFVQNVEYNTTKEELVEIFKDCGQIEKVTIPQSRQGTGKGFAYVQFNDKISVELAKALSDSIHRGRAIKVLPKRTNQHGFKKKPFKPNGFIKYLMKGFMFGGAGYLKKKKFNPN